MELSKLNAAGRPRRLLRLAEEPQASLPTPFRLVLRYAIGNEDLAR
jgi:hypothetical protein